MRKNFEYWPVKSSWCRCSQSKSFSEPFTTSESQIFVNEMPAYCSAIVTASSHGAALGGAYTATFDAFSGGAASQRVEVGNQKRSAAIVQQPLRLETGLDGSVRQAVGLEVIGLHIIHRDEQ